MPFFGWWCGWDSELFRQAAVDEEVGAGDVAGTVTREQKREVGDLFGFGESPRRESAAALDDAATGFVERDAHALRHGGGDAVVAQPERRRDRSGTDRVEADAASAVLLRERLGEVPHRG